MIHIDYTENSLQDIALRDAVRVLSHTLAIIVRVATCHMYQYWCFMDAMNRLFLSAFYLRYLLKFTERYRAQTFPRRTTYVYIYIYIYIYI
jgi:hypothetical protein